MVMRWCGQREGRGKETLGNYFTDESEGMREYNLPPSSFHPTFVSGGLMLIHTNWLHYSRFIHLHCFFSLFRDHSSLPSLLPRLSSIYIQFLLISHQLIFNISLLFNGKNLTNNFEYSRSFQDSSSFFFLSSFPIFHSHEIPVEETCCLTIFIFKEVFYCEIPNRDLIIQLCVHRDSSDYSLFPKICNNESMK